MHTNPLHGYSDNNPHYTIFEEVCLKDISDFIKLQTMSYKLKKNG
jgi:hypothetical protein